MLRLPRHPRPKQPALLARQAQQVAVWRVLPRHRLDLKRFKLPLRADGFAAVALFQFAPALHLSRFCALVRFGQGAYQNCELDSAVKFDNHRACQLGLVVPVLTLIQFPIKGLRR